MQEEILVVDKYDVSEISNQSEGHTVVLIQGNVFGGVESEISKAAQSLRQSRNLPILWYLPQYILLESC